MSTWYEEQIAAIGLTLTAAAIDRLTHYEEGDLAQDELTELLELLFLAAAAKATYASTAAHNLTLEARHGLDDWFVLPPGKQNYVDLLTGIITEETPEPALKKLAHNLPRQVGAEHADDLVRLDERVRGWTRGLDADPCELCVWWWRNGHVFAADQDMRRHPGCTCQKVPTVIEGTPVNLPPTDRSRAILRARNKRIKEAQKQAA